MASGSSPQKEPMPVQEWLKFQFTEITTAAEILKDTCESVQKRKFDLVLPDLEGKTPFTGKYTSSIVRDCQSVIVEHIHTLLNIESELRKEMATRFPADAKRVKYATINVPAHCKVRIQSPSETDCSSPEKGSSRNFVDRNLNPELDDLKIEVKAAKRNLNDEDAAVNSDGELFAPCPEAVSTPMPKENIVEKEVTPPVESEDKNSSEVQLPDTNSADVVENSEIDTTALLETNESETRSTTDIDNQPLTSSPPTKQLRSRRVSAQSEPPPKEQFSKKRGRRPKRIGKKTPSTSSDDQQPKKKIGKKENKKVDANDRDEEVDVDEKKKEMEKSAIVEDEAKIKDTERHDTEENNTEEPTAVTTEKIASAESENEEDDDDMEDANVTVVVPKSKKGSKNNNKEDLALKKAVLEDDSDVASDATTEGSSADELPDLKAKDAKPGPSRSIISSGKSLASAEAENDPRLALTTKIVLDKLDPIILKEVEETGVLRLGLGEYEKEKDELSECIKKLRAYNPILSSKESKSKKGKNKPGPKSSKKAEKENHVNEMNESESDDNESLDKTKLKNMVGKKSKSDVESGDDVIGDDLDSVKASSEDEKDKKAVLADSDASNSKSKSKKYNDKKGKSYKTPKVNDGDDDDDEDSDDSNPPVKKKTQKSKQKSGTSESSDFDVAKPKRKLLKGSKRKDSSASLVSESKSSEESSSARTKRRNTRNSKRNKSPSSDTDEDSKKKPKKKLRRRIHNASTDSSNDEGDTTLKASEKGRKNIRKVIKGKNLEKSTRQAGIDEEERKKRVLEKQKLFNEHFKAPEATELELTQVVLDFDPETKEPLLSVDPELVKKLKPHQGEGIRFMFNACFESVAKKGKGDGCILAHCMGLGKTLQTIGFLHTVLTNKKLLKLRTALVICPLSTVGNWYNEFKMWLRDVDRRVNLHRLWESKPHQRMNALEDWQRLGGVGIIHYDAFRLLVTAEDKKGKKKSKPKELQIIRETLIDPGADIVVCDEGHLLKNPQSQQSKAVNKVATRRRIVLTGTPLQNNLLEYHTMMQFVKPSLLGSRKEFSNRFVNPILNGQHKDSDDRDVKIMKRRAHVLHKLLDGCVQRLDYSVLTPFLPPKYEYALTINLTDIQKKLYKHYIDNLIGNRKGDKFVTSKLFADYQVLVKVWTHPKVLTFKSRAQERQDNSDSEEGSLKDFINDKSTSEEEMTTDDDSRSSRSDRSGSGSDWSLERRKKKKKAKAAVIDDDDDVEEVPKEEEVQVIKEAEPEKVEEEPTNQIPSKWYMPFLDSLEDYNALEHSGKLLVLMEILKTCESIGDRVLVFSQFLTSLDLIEDILAEIDEESKKSNLGDGVRLDDDQPLVGRWRHGIEYFRIDGSTKTDDRQRSCETFNQESASKAKLFLISTRAGGLGINLVGANRVVIFDASWNPSQDLQSIFRVFRFGQLKPCYIYRLLARGTMEEKIYNRQVVKLSLSCRVVDEQQIERHFHFDEISQMYQFDADDPTERPTPIVPKDRLLADLLISHKDWIFSYLEHDSLLENKEEEELTEAERKAAWEEYNNMNESQQNLRGPGNLAQDPWILQTAQHFAKLNPGKPDMQYLLDAHRAKIEVQTMVNHWDYIHNDTVNDFFKRTYREKFDQLFAMLSLKFGPTANWDPVLRHYPHQNNYPNEYVYTRPTTNKATRRLQAAMAAHNQQQLRPTSINNIAQAYMRGPRTISQNGAPIANSSTHIINTRAPLGINPSIRTYPGVNIVPSKSIFETVSSTTGPSSSKPSILKTIPTPYVPPAPKQPRNPQEPADEEVIVLDNE